MNIPGRVAFFFFKGKGLGGVKGGEIMVNVIYKRRIKVKKKKTRINTSAF